jgi:NAD(P)-dependent dehydrogenase (short-subunit alcohol dehydrogenase family)
LGQQCPAVKAEQVDATSVDLPPGTKVIGWEPVEDAASLPSQYAERVATIPTTKSKLDALANAAGILQLQIDSMRNDVKYAHARIATEEKYSDQLAKIIDANAGGLANDVSFLMMKTNQLDDLKRKLDDLNDFKDVVCPILRGANISDLARITLNSACGLH